MKSTRLLASAVVVLVSVSCADGQGVTDATAPADAVHVGWAESLVVH